MWLHVGGDDTPLLICLLLVSEQRPKCEFKRMLKRIESLNKLKAAMELKYLIVAYKNKCRWYEWLLLKRILMFYSHLFYTCGLVKITCRNTAWYILYIPTHIHCISPSFFFSFFEKIAYHLLGDCNWKFETTNSVYFYINIFSKMTKISYFLVFDNNSKNRLKNVNLHFIVLHRVR